MYLKGWFLIDVMAIMPLDVIIKSTQGSVSSQGQVNSLIRVTRIGKLYKLVKVTRLVRLLKVVK